ncbi:MAG: TRAP transporter substrate-binding protein DctP [Verrucomicrobiota bacterium]|nr:TRAP transporter substrate-binding protein DctP [Verrucomicrobiota bacterium]
MMMKQSDQSFLGLPPGCRFLLALMAYFCLGMAFNLDAAQRFRLGTLAPKGSSYYNHLQKMGQAWKKAPGGGVSLTIYPDGRLGGEAEMVRRIRAGQLQLGLLTGVGLAEIEPKVTGLQDVPMMYRSLKEVEYIADQLGGGMALQVEAKGFVILGWTHAGWVHFFAKTPIRTIDDVRKTKIFTWAGNPQVVKVLQNNGFRPVPLETKDIVTGLQTGMITSVCLPPLAANFSQVDTRAPYMLKLKWGALLGGLVISKKAWDSLSGPQQAHMRSTAEETVKAIQEDGLREAEESILAMEKRGLTVIEPTVEELEEWRRETEKAYPDIQKLMVDMATFEKVQRLLEAYRKR